MSLAPLPRTEYPHLALEHGSVPTIAGTTMKVIEVVLAREAHGWSPEEIHFQHPYLTLAQIRLIRAYEVLRRGDQRLISAYEVLRRGEQRLV